MIAPIKPYFTYAAQMRQSVPVMAYQCKFFAVVKGLDLCKANPGEQSDKAKAFLAGEMADLEAMKTAMGEVSKEDMKFHVENFVLSVFAQTDKEERTCETITRKNAVDFKRCSDFIALLEVFEGAYTDEWKERRKYCMYKAGTIQKALKAGEQPPRGNPFAPEEENKAEEVKQEDDPVAVVDPVIPSPPSMPEAVPAQDPQQIPQDRPMSAFTA